MYETTDAFTKYLPAEYANLVKYVQVNGRTKIALRNVISEYIPNPTFNKVAPPGAQEIEFRLKNPSSKHQIGTGFTLGKSKSDQIAERVPGMPPRYIEAPPAFFDPAARLQLMDEQKVDRAMMWPTLASLLEERLADDPKATAVVVHALNEWMHEHWTYNFENRIFATPVINLSIVDEAIKELDYVVERGARAVLIRPATVPDFGVRRRSFALPEFDPFWARVQESGTLVGMHSSDDGYTRYTNEWNGITDEMKPFGGRNKFTELVGSEYRSIRDAVYSIIGHGLATRFPDIRFMPVENGSQWVPTAIKQFKKIYAVDPGSWDEDPIVALHRSIVVHPFFEEDVMAIVNAIGVDNVVFGSDYPHPEGMADPTSFVEELDDSLSEDEKAKIMGGNLSKLMKCDPVEKVIAA
ncbi:MULTISPECIES: amidohydrolase family protein [unclassified Pseudofrankia]|uniref:amidohydrolase family protein n=1 Tax=unclassified Pseudofrankia TaxID=2994372 RepID=UPI0008DA0973|nr:MULTISPECIES: amidohydrolase family protein [unclassified Pseudofrankia]MDT3443864.1 amidohydrolase family protein [Pseudofrankia sp. BMG5.37]OHV60869.1 amidohydrolase [Pseudofrankia sp. BMG5.36]